MSGEAEARHIRHRMGLAQDAGGAVLRADHGGVAGRDIGAAGKAAHRGGQDHAGAEGPGQDQRIARSCAGEGEWLAREQAGEGEADGELVTLRGMPAGDGGAGSADHLGSGGHDLGKGAGLELGRHGGQDQADEGGLRRGAHGPDIARR